MALNISRVDVWAASIDDKPGGLADKLAALSAAGRSWSSSSPGGPQTSPVRESCS